MNQGLHISRGNVNLATVLVFLIMARLSCTLFSVFPFMSITFIFIYGIIFVFLFLVSYRKIKSSDFLTFIILLLYDSVVIFKNVDSLSKLFTTDAFNCYILTFLYFIYLWVKYSFIRFSISKRENKIHKGLLFTVLGGYIMTIVYSLFVLVRDPLSIRIAATGQHVATDIFNSAAGFDTVYGSVLIIMICLVIHESTKSLLIRRIMIISLLLICVFLIMASYGTAILLGIFAFVLYYLRKNQKMSVFMIFLIILLLVLREPISDLLFDLSHKVTYSDYLSRKIYEFGYMLKNGELTGTYTMEEGRLDRMGYSLKTFLQYPVFGGKGHADARFGGHSDFFDVLGKYGIVGFGAIFSFWVRIYMDLNRITDNQSFRKCLLSVMILYFMISILNPSMYTQEIIPILVVLPLYCYVYCANNNEVSI